MFLILFDGLSAFEHFNLWLMYACEKCMLITLDCKTLFFFLYLRDIAVEAQQK